jgi:hypothetical protein
MATKKFPSEMSSRGPVKITDKLMICDIDTGATEYTTVAELLAALGALSNSVGINTVTPQGLFTIKAKSSVSTDNFIIESSSTTHPVAKIGTFMVDGDTGGLQFLAANVIKVQINAGGDSYFNGGNLSVGTAIPTSKLQVTGLPQYTDNTNAAASGLTAGAFYRTGDNLKVVH